MNTTTLSRREPTLEVAGVNHADPLGSPRLREWLLALDSTAKSTLRFVAVEYDASHLPEIVTQRPRFRDLVKREWPFLTPDDHTALERSLAYDGDAHRAIFPDVATVWLDQGRSDPGVEFEVATFAQGRLECLRRHARSLTPGRDDFLLRLSRSLWAGALADRRPIGDERDRRFADVVISACVEHQLLSRAIVVVGASHARPEVSDSFVSLVQAAGIPCRVTILDPTET
jgi:hypothetical protein